MSMQLQLRLQLDGQLQVTLASVMSLATTYTGMVVVQATLLAHPYITLLAAQYSRTQSQQELLLDRPTLSQYQLIIVCQSVK